MSTEMDEQPDSITAMLDGVNLNDLARVTGLSRRTLTNARSGAHKPHQSTMWAIKEGLRQLRSNEAGKGVHLEDEA